MNILNKKVAYVEVPEKCFQEYGGDLDSCSTQEREGCAACVLSIKHFEKDAVKDTFTNK